MPCSQFTVHRSPTHETGFTLIEIIVALVIVAVLAAMIYPVTIGQWRTAKGVGEVRELFELQGQMEKIVADYKNELSEDGDINLSDFLTSVTNEYSDSIDQDSTNFIDDSGADLELTDDTTSLLLVTLQSGSQRIACIFSGK